LFDTIFTKIDKEIQLTREDALALLQIDNNSEDFYKLLSKANEYSRKQYNNQGKIFAQLGLDFQSCSVNCKFCSLAKDVFKEKSKIKTMDELRGNIYQLLEQNIDEIFLMTTADFPKELFLEYGKIARKIMPPNMPLVANTGDFSLAYAEKLKQIGFTGVYHICRLGEGVDSDVTIDTRINTLEAIKNSNLELYYCIEPIGPEHSDEEIVEEMMRAMNYPIYVMAVMKRVAVENTQLYEKGEITSATLAKICSVTTLVVRPQRAMGVHEPNELSLMSGANQIYCECGSNPRDIISETAQGRGCEFKKAKSYLSNTEWKHY